MELERLQSSVELSATDAMGDALHKIRLVPSGVTETKKGRVVLDADSARSVIEAFEKHATPLVIDWEHQSLSDGRAPAAGWCERLWYEPGRGLLGLAKWNQAARDAIRAKEYLFLSPVLVLNKETRRVVAVDSIALTNRPAVPAMERLVASDRDLEIKAFAGEKAMQLVGELRSALGMTEAASVEEVLGAALERLKGAKEADTVSASMRERLGLKPDAAAAEVLLSLDARLVQTASRAVELEAEEIIREALSANKICAADKERINWLRGMALKDVVMAREVLANLPQWQVPGRTTAPNRESTERGREIRMAMSAFSEDPRSSKLTSARSFIDMALRDKNLVKLTDLEVGQYSIAV